ncbi:MAG TPA: hypothetical protein VK446_14410 [Methylocystis sp.]|nr:hypothetical protein [Methylocystis sp.]
MSPDWQYQLRVNLSEAAAALARQNPFDEKLAPLPQILARHGATLKNQYAAFADYCAEAERNGVEAYPLYRWTKSVVEDPAKQAKYALVFTLYVDGEEVYAKGRADALEADLQPLVGGGTITTLARHDTNPASNPQPPAGLR